MVNVCVKYFFVKKSNNLFIIVWLEVFWDDTDTNLEFK